ncbi:hypothetical protein [Rhodopseudomonas sp.]|uniref:hypothetical protein n=1 Tax=Rhodopseudomonas sp. TaxID=1078 RepID=UPI003451BFDE
MLHPGWQRRGRRIIIESGSRHRQPVLLIAVWLIVAARLRYRIGPTEIGKRISLTDQPRQLSQRIALAALWGLLRRAVMLVGRGERSVLISIGHRDVAAPSG